MVGIFYVHSICLLIITTNVNVNYGLRINHQLNTVVKYLGEDYYLKDGCPLPDCDDRERGCFKRQIELKKKFNGCYSGKSGKYMGCIHAGRIVLPVFAKYCSKICYYDGDDAKLEEVIHCPHNGTRHDEVDEILQREMLRKHPTTTTTTERIVSNPDRTIGLSTLLDDENLLENRKQDLINRGLRPAAFGSFDRTPRRRTTARTPVFSNSSRAPRRQTAQLEKTLHQLIQEGFFSDRKDSSLESNNSEDPPLVQSSTILPFTTPDSVVENVDDVQGDWSLKTENQEFPIADASTLVDPNEPEEDSTDRSPKSIPIISS